jgi:hydroxymethylbilane synthase
MARKINIGSRGSDLALWQAYFTKKQLEDLGHTVEINIIKTKGDQIQHLSFDKIEGKGFFTKELEDALLQGSIDLAVHSHKDLPTTFPPGLTISGVSYREDCSESILIRPEAYQSTLPLGLRMNARVGTSSFRRRSQLLAIRPDLEITDLRGNVPTRVDKLRQGNYDAIVLASAGLNRLNLDLSDLQRQILPPHFFVPAPAQGVLAFQTRETDTEMRAIIAQIHHTNVQDAIFCERSVLNQMQGGCLLPLGVFCQFTGNDYQVWACLQPADGKSFRKVYLRGKDTQQLVEKTLLALTRSENRRVFISREPEHASTFSNQVRNYGFQVLEQSPLKFESIEIRHLPFADWVFFTSPRSVVHFYNQDVQLPKHTQIAVMGSGTADTLSEYGFQADFIGNDGDTGETAQEFLAKAAGKTIVFPSAESGLRKVQLAMEAQADVHDLIVYRTLEQEITFDLDADILVLTSPSSVHALKNRFDSTKHIFVAIGQSTAAALHEVGIEQVHVAPYTTMQSLADLVCGL